MADRDGWGPVEFEDHVTEAGFVTLPVAVVFAPDLSPGAKTLYAALLWWGWKHRKAPPQDRMGEELGVTARTVKRFVAELEAGGYIRSLRQGLGQANRYVVCKLPTVGTDLSLQRGQELPFSGDRFGPSLVVEQDSTTPDSLSDAPALTDAFFAAVGEGKPSKQRRERAVAVVNDLTAEGFTPEAIAEACRLAGERHARGPDLLPHLIGEAHSAVQAREAEARRRAQIATTTQAADLSDDAALSADLEAVAALPAAKRKKLEAECRAALPATVSEGFMERVLPGMMAARVRGGGGG